VRKRLLDRLQGPSAQLQKLASAELSATGGSAAPLFADSATDEKNLGPIIAQFRNANYQRYLVGDRPQRYFRFNLDELWSILAHEGTPPEHSATSDTAGIALVLTGGGVKAAYQTRMIDHLYGDAHLVNAANQPTPATQRVKYVIGTSGGALLGVFVSAINEELLAAFKSQGGQGLTKIIWDTPGKGIDSRDVFPFLDMPRYGTVLAAFVVLMLVAWIARFYRRWRARQNPTNSSAALDAPAFGPGRLTESVLWYALLMLSPFVLILTCRFGGIEEVPWITGVVYAGVLVISLYADVRLKRTARLALGGIRMSRSSWGAVALAVAGAIALVLAITEFFGLTRVAGQKDPAAVRAACAGVCALAFALYFFFASQKHLFEREPRKPIVRAFLIVTAIVIASYIVLWFGSLARRATMLEVTGVFWVWFISTTAVLSMVIVLLARVGASVSKPSHGWLHSTFEYLFGEYRSWTTTSTAHRYARFIAVGFIGWLWWNLLAAPSLYGNNNAQDYFQAAFARFANTVAAIKGVIPLDDRTSYPLTVPFVITATSLEKGRELYFLFLGDTTGRGPSATVTDPIDTAAIDSQLSNYAWSSIASDSRWFVLRRANGKDLRDTAFASGSPFPVFAAHTLNVSALRTPENLIDGGFAHNRPLEAARVLGASKVLVINSSPLGAGPAGAHCRLIVRVGDLACNLPKLLPYLWDRSQIEDVLSTKNMLVVSIYPTADEGGWPLLTDFRGEVVERLVAAADADMKRRIGVVDSWGRRGHSSTSELFQYDTSVIK
jgi:predicted acylesterase/phospholipase RssA